MPNRPDLRRRQRRQNSPSRSLRIWLWRVHALRLPARARSKPAPRGPHPSSRKWSKNAAGRSPRAVAILERHTCEDQSPRPRRTAGAHARAVGRRPQGRGWVARRPVCKRFGVGTPANRTLCSSGRQDSNLQPPVLESGLGRVRPSEPRYACVEGPTFPPALEWCCRVSAVAAVRRCSSCRRPRAHRAGSGARSC